jgi:hypothetical protein
MVVEEEVELVVEVRLGKVEVEGLERLESQYLHLLMQDSWLAEKTAGFAVS